MSSRHETFTCPVCGEDVPVKARACPECGACDKSGWNDEDSYLDGVDLPEGYDEDFAGGKTRDGFDSQRSGKQWLWWAVALVLLIAFALLALRQ